MVAKKKAIGRARSAAGAGLHGHELRETIRAIDTELEELVKHNRVSLRRVGL